MSAIAIESGGQSIEGLTFRYWKVWKECIIDIRVYARCIDLACQRRTDAKKISGIESNLVH